MFQRIKDNPRQFPFVEGVVYRALLNHFPYGVYFFAESEDIGVTALERALKFVENRHHALDVGCGCEGRFIRILQEAGFNVPGWMSQKPWSLWRPHDIRTLIFR